jgi:hypothetical protein
MLVRVPQQPPRRSSSRSRVITRLGLLLLAVVVGAAWVTVHHLISLRTFDATGRGLLYVWHDHDSFWWSGAVIQVALVTSLALLVWLLRAGVRLLPGPWRIAGEVLAAIVGAAGLLVALALGFLSMFFFDGTLLTVDGPGGVTRVVTQDGYDGDAVVVYRPVGRSTYLRESGDQGQISLDPRRGSCLITEPPATKKLILSCGDTSYLIP